MEPTTDEAFFEMIHELLEKGLVDHSPQKEKRRNKRLPFECKQLMAPQISQSLPQAANFSTVDCYDLSSRGFSFFAGIEPEYSELVVAMGDVPFTFILATVRNVRLRRRQGENCYTVGCQFLRRIE